MKIGIIQEGKTPADSRVPLSPEQCGKIQQDYDIEVKVQPSSSRCFPDEAYQAGGINLTDDLSDCDVLMGVKEVPIRQLMPDKTYFFFSHTIKKQPYNRQLLWAILDKNIRLIDYEVLTNKKRERLIAFGKFAGMVGAHNAIWTYGKRSASFALPRMHTLTDYQAARSVYQKLSLPPIRIVLTGTGRVANGAALVLRDMGIEQISPRDFLKKTFTKTVFTQLDCVDYAVRKDGARFVLQDFFDAPHRYKSIFLPFAQTAEVMINGIFWDSRAPAFFTLEEMAGPGFKLKVIADVTFNIAPVSSIPSTIKASTIADPVFGFDPVTRQEIPAFSPQGIDMMTIANLPNELPRDASVAFGEQFIQHILPELLQERSEVIERATVTKAGVLGKHFQYLVDYAGLDG